LSLVNSVRASKARCVRGDVRRAFPRVKAVQRPRDRGMLVECRLLVGQRFGP
jgi:hypothetical protein